MSERHRVVPAASTVVRVVREREVTFLAASLAYYALVSLVPLGLLVVVVATFVGGEAFRTVALDAVRTNLPAGEPLVAQALDDRLAGGGLGLLSFALTLWGALKLFRGVDLAFSRIYGTRPAGLLDQLRDGLVALASIGAGVLAVTLVGAGIALVELPFKSLLGALTLFVTLLAVFLPLYAVFPDPPVSLREALPGAAVVAVGWSVLGAGFGLYADATGGSVAGALGALLLMVTWFYLSGMLLLTGVVVNAVLGGRIADRQVQLPGRRRASKTDMSEREGERDEVEPRGAPDVADLEDRLEELRADLDAFEDDVNDRTVKKPELEAELERYVRRKMRRGKARGWGPYLVLLYGTVLTLGAFFFLDGVWAILAMVVLFLSTLGLYVVFVAVGLGLNVLDVPGRAIDAVRERRK